MSRQDVGNPNFFIDLPSYWRAKGNLKSVGVPPNNHPTEAGYIPDLIGLNPTNHIKVPLIWEDFMGVEEAVFKYKMSLNRDVDISDNIKTKLFFGCLGHNLGDFISTFVNFYIDDGNAHLYHNYEANYSTTLQEVCNLQRFTDIEYSGWSLARDSNFFGRNILNATFEITISVHENQDEHPFLYLGSLCFGYVYRMPHSPDLKLTMTREYDGIRDQQTIGGSTLTHIQYASAPEWAGLPAWELAHPDNSNIHNNITGGIKEVRSPARGRRVWELSFSYIDSSDVFSSNELYGYGNPTDSDTNSNAGYDSSLFDSDGNFLENIETDNSFFSRLMEKTMGGALRFVFQPDSNNNSPDQFAICKIDQNSIKLTQVASNVYSVRMVIREVW